MQCFNQTLMQLNITLRTVTRSVSASATGCTGDDTDIGIALTMDDASLSTRDLQPEYVVQPHDSR